MVPPDDTAAATPSRSRRPHPVRVAALGVALLAAVAVGVSVVPAGALPGPWSRPSAPVTAAPGDADATCARPAAPEPSTTTTTAPVAAATLTQRVTVVVPPIVRVLDDRDGRLTVRSNAGRPPAAGDQVWVRQPDGDYLRADEATTARVLAARWADGGWCSTTAEHHSLA